MSRVAFLLALWLAVPGAAFALEEEPEEAEAEPAEEGSPLAAAAWCSLKRHREPAAVAVEGEVPATEDTRDPPSACDLGVGIALYRWGRLALVAVVGTASVGSGAAWIVVCPYDSQGIYAGECGPALGATISFARAGR